MFGPRDWLQADTWPETTDQAQAPAFGSAPGPLQAPHPFPQGPDFRGEPARVGFPAKHQAGLACAQTLLPGVGTLLRERQGSVWAEKTPKGSGRASWGCLKKLLQAEGLRMADTHPLTVWSPEV